jgi:hypothetical protein
MSRRHPRIRAQLTVTLTLHDSDDVLVCRTRDISQRGCFLDTAQIIDPGTRLQIALLDERRGAAIDLAGEVMRCLPPGPDGLGRGIGVRFVTPPEDWDLLVSGYEQEYERPPPPPRRMRVLVVGDRAQQRAAMALYVTSGWDVRFAVDLSSVEDALHGVTLNAIIAENELEDERWKAVLEVARQLQPQARRIVRSALHGHQAPASSGARALFHRIVDRESGLEALVDAITAELTEAQ